VATHKVREPSCNPKKPWEKKGARQRRAKEQKDPQRGTPQRARRKRGNRSKPETLRKKDKREAFNPPFTRKRLRLREKFKGPRESYTQKKNANRKFLLLRKPFQKSGLLGGNVEHLNIKYKIRPKGSNPILFNPPYGTTCCKT